MRKLSKVTIAVLATIMVFWSVLPANAINIDGGKFGMVGITRGQTARLNVVSVTPPDVGRPVAVGMCMVELMFFDSDGNMLGTMMMVENLGPGMAEFLDFNPATLDPVPEGRLQIRAEVLVRGDKKSCDVIATLEVYDNTTMTMKTEVFYPGYYHPAPNR